jgi:hypothetical protein
MRALPEPNFEPLGVKPKVACRMIPCGMTKLYQLIADGEIESYCDGKSRIISVASIRRRHERLLADAKSSSQEGA